MMKNKIIIVISIIAAIVLFKILTTDKQPSTKKTNTHNQIKQNQTPTKTNIKLKKNEKQEAAIDEDAKNWQELGAFFCAEAITEGDRDKLSKGIRYFEKAYTKNPQNKVLTIDLADAYMQVNSPQLTAIAIDLYESVFTSFDDDKLIERLAAGYFQIKNTEVAIALTEERLKHCPQKSIIQTAVQLAFFSSSCGKEDTAIATISKITPKENDKNKLKLIVAILQKSKGCNKDAIDAIDEIIANSKINPKIKQYAVSLKEEFTND